MSNRDPFSCPRPENDFTFSGFRRLQTKTNEKPTHIAQTEEPWCQLHDSATLASNRRSVMHSEHQVSNDSLDFQLKSVYDHHKDSFFTKNQMLHQKETISNGQVTQEKQDTLDMEQVQQEKDIRRWADPQRGSVKGFQK
ncbi:cilia- and flagella-associated protein 276 [Antennarius striatus]|uniref:cilia- and flagella-associated protein 276 n=1 Tax=Antennarius striatus TaxID=241820 RepID=UPI0035B25B44